MGHFGSKVFVAELALWDEPNVGLKCQYPGPVNVSAITNLDKNFIICNNQEILLRLRFVEMFFIDQLHMLHNQ